MFVINCKKLASNHYRWWLAYREAQQFRFSHYFISYISEATCLLMGIGTLVPLENKSDEKDARKGKPKIDSVRNKKDGSMTADSKRYEVKW